MIEKIGNIIHISTANTSYIIKINKYNDVQNLYYGQKIERMEDYTCFDEERTVLLVNGLYRDGDVSYCVDDFTYEISTPFRGDLRESAVELHDSVGMVFSFKYHDIAIGEAPNNNFQAASYGYDDSLAIILKDELRNVYLKLWYLVYNDCDVITRMTEIVNDSGKELVVDKIMSMQLDLFDNKYSLVNFTGAWSRERYKHARKLSVGKHVIESNSGFSSGKHNPMIILCSNDSKECYGFNMVYSGNHYESVEVCQYDHVRVLQGINPSNFSYVVNDNFITPESVMSYAVNDNVLSQNMHKFTANHIIRGYWQFREKPVLANSWESFCFDITEDKILELADAAKYVGAELLVLDDGWFHKRNNDTTSLGDWSPDELKFPKGMKYISDKVHAKELLFGLWFEPEMISADSDLYRAHPNWAMKIEGITSIVGRGQLILDLSNVEVQDYLITTITQLILDNGIDYVKWDCNRQFSDVVARGFNCGEVLHRFILGLYRVQDNITRNCYKTLFELCASGGNRFDLGMLCYSPVGWVSDNTDVLSRANVQEGTGYAYPIGSMCCHISDVPNYQTKRVTRLIDRYNIASFGVLGMQLDLTKMSDELLQSIAKYISHYKGCRKLMQYGIAYRYTDGFEGNIVSWGVMDEDGNNGRIFVMNKLFKPVMPTTKIKLQGLDPCAMYVVTEEHNDNPHVCTATGDVLMKSGLVLRQNCQGNEIQRDTRLMTDYTTITYSVIKKSAN